MTNLLDEVKKRPKLSTAGLTAVSVIGFFYAWDKLSPTLEFTVKLRNAPAMAEAALQKATEAREWIDAYIEQQRQQQELERQRYELEQEFNKQLLDMQRQQQQWQAPTQSSQPQHPPPQMQAIPNLPYAPPRWEWRQDEDGNWFCQGERESWWPDEQTGGCE